MKSISLISFLFLINCGTFFTQTINFKDISLAFDTWNYDAIAYSDVDLDGDIDLMVSKWNTELFINKTELYKNDGLGNFTIYNESFFGNIYCNSITFADIDGDTDEDLLICGSTSSSVYFTRLYKNIGNGNFELVSGTTFPGVDASSVGFSDIDNDGDLDLLLSGQINLTWVTNLYRNNGSGGFSLINGTPFESLRILTVNFGDVDADGDNDMLLTEENQFNFGTTINLYLNDALGNFIEVENSTFVSGGSKNSIHFVDIDNDDDLDIIAAGYNNDFNSMPETNIYKNDGVGTFEVVNNTGLINIATSSINHGDFDNDGDEDIVIFGVSRHPDPMVPDYVLIENARLYYNDGNGFFTEQLDTQLEAVGFAKSLLFDINNDGVKDLFVVGQNSSENKIAKFYLGDGQSNFLEKDGTNLKGLYKSDIAFADIDNDGDLDVLTSGKNRTSEAVSILYKNDGLGNYSIFNPNQIVGVYECSIAFSDVDNDGDQDLFVSGLDNSDISVSKLYFNDGLGNFSENMESTFENVGYSEIVFSDTDNDGDEDLLITGFNNQSQLSTVLYTNQGNGLFVENTNSSFIGTMGASIAIFDYDNDNDKDVLIIGVGSNKLYKNDGIGNFSIVNGVYFTESFDGDIAVSDIDNDNDIDVLITGSRLQNGSYVPYFELYTNNGNGTFIANGYSDAAGIRFSSVAFSDVDSDGDDDLLFTGQKSDESLVAILYANDGTGGFTIVEKMPFDKCAYSSIAFADVDGDGDQDVLFTGKTLCEQQVTKLYKNIIDFCENSTELTLNNLFVLPSEEINCTGNLMIETNIESVNSIQIDFNTINYNNSNTNIFSNLCPGIHNLTLFNECNDSLSTEFVIPELENFLFNNPFIDSLAQDSLGVNIENCELFFAGITQAYIDSIWANGNIVTVVWNIIDSTGLSIDTTTYTLNNGSGVYYLQLSVFCPQKSLGNYFTVTEAIYFNNGVATLSNEEINFKHLSVYPNPTKNTISILLEDNMNSVNLNIFDTKGMIVFTKEIMNKEEINLQEFESGMYFFEIHNEKGKFIRRVIKY
jgi:hypothetical protein